MYKIVHRDQVTGIAICAYSVSTRGDGNPCVRVEIQRDNGDTLDLSTAEWSALHDGALALTRPDPGGIDWDEILHAAPPQRPPAAPKADHG